MLSGGRERALAGSAAYLRMMAVTTGGAALADGALTSRSTDFHDADVHDEAADRATLARFFASNRLASVPGLLAAVTESAADLAAAGERILAG